MDDLAHFRRPILGDESLSPGDSQGCVDRTSTNLQSRQGNHRRSPSLFHISHTLLHFETRVAEKRVVSKIEAKFNIFDSPPPVKIKGGMGELAAWLHLYDRTSGIQRIHLMGGVSAVAESRVQVKKIKRNSTVYVSVY